jgi:hypothetical protein
LCLQFLYFLRRICIEIHLIVAFETERDTRIFVFGAHSFVSLRYIDVPRKGMIGVLNMIIVLSEEQKKIIANTTSQ